MDTFCNFVSNNMAVSTNFEPGLAVVPFSLAPEVVYGDREVCSFYSSDFPPIYNETHLRRPRLRCFPA
jgi:hypothetical protein